jgi:hypothetical protein
VQQGQLSHSTTQERHALVKFIDSTELQEIRNTEAGY